jgi:small glutamine-rich tetratricopeptide repeat-containing protein alpha
MGLAYASLNDHYRARDCYKKAVELDPSNESYINNLSIAEEKVSELERQDPLSALAGGLGNFDIGSVLQNPALMQMASQVMADPAMQNIMTNIMGGVGGQTSQAPPTSASSGEVPSSASNGSSGLPGGLPGGLPNLANLAGGAGGLDGLLRAGQAFAQRMQETNPELISQLRDQVQRTNPGSNPNNDTNKQE